MMRSPVAQAAEPSNYADIATSPNDPLYFRLGQPYTTQRIPITEPDVQAMSGLVENIRPVGQWPYTSPSRTVRAGAQEKEPSVRALPLPEMPAAVKAYEDSLRSYMSAFSHTASKYADRHRETYELKEKLYTILFANSSLSLHQRLKKILGNDARVPPVSGCMWHLAVLWACCLLRENIVAPASRPHDSPLNRASAIDDVSKATLHRRIGTLAIRAGEAVASFAD